jgi:branched-chain amino acid transport system ATP-binding protein
MMLESNDLTKAFGGVVAIHHLSLKVEKGTIFGIIGPNGSGKTTFFNLVTGMLTPNSGKVIFDGKDITGLRPHQVARLGIGRTFQIPAPFSKMTVLGVMVSSFIHHPTLKTAKQAQEIWVGQLAEKARQQVVNVTLEDQNAWSWRALATKPSSSCSTSHSGLRPSEIKTPLT